MKLPEKEEQLMEIIWNANQIFMKDILDTYPTPKPAPTTVATLLKRLTEKNILGYVEYGNSRQYYAKIKKTDYFSKHVKGIIKNYFDNSPMQFASFFTTSTNLTTSELEGLKKIVDQEIKRKRK